MATETWDIVFYRADDGSVPAHAWFKSIPQKPRRQLVTFLLAVRAYPPYRFPPCEIWQPMKKTGSVDMSGFYESRDQHDKRDYRVFCILDREATKNGLPDPALVIIAGADKPDRTKLDDREYLRVKALAADYRANPRKAVRPTGFPSWLEPKARQP